MYSELFRVQLAVRLYLVSVVSARLVAFAGFYIHVIWFGESGYAWVAAVL